MLTTLTKEQCKKFNAYFMIEMSELDDALSAAQSANFLGSVRTTVVY